MMASFVLISTLVVAEPIRSAADSEIPNNETPPVATSVSCARTLLSAAPGPPTANAGAAAVDVPATTPHQQPNVLNFAGLKPVNEE
jgi:hypothetical protein